MNNTGMPPLEKSDVELGYVRLTDAAPFIIARELGFFDRHGLNVSLRQEVSWANIRDKLVTGSLDGAHMLAPLPAMTTLGVSGLRSPLISGLVLCRNGNAITLSTDLLDTLSPEAHAVSERLISASVLKSAFTGKPFTRKNRPTLAVVHGFSTHNLMLRRWLKQGGLDPDKDVSVIVVPPAQVVDSLRAGVIDGFCAGAPWGSIAALEGVGFTAAAGMDVWMDAPEKVFCVSQAWHQAFSGTHLRLRLALYQACEWLADMDNREECADILSMPCYLDLPRESLLPSLIGQMVLGPHQTIQAVPGFHQFRPDPPEIEQFESMIGECMEMVGIETTGRTVSSIARQTARHDLYEETRAWLTPGTEVMSP